MGFTGVICYPMWIGPLCRAQAQKVILNTTDLKFRHVFVHVQNAKSFVSRRCIYPGSLQVWFNGKQIYLGGFDTPEQVSGSIR